MTPEANNRSELAAAVWCTLADAGHTAAIDSLTGDGYQISYTPGAVLVTLARGAGQARAPWAAVQKQTLQEWADTLAAGGYSVASIGHPAGPNALRVAPPAQKSPNPTPLPLAGPTRTETRDGH